MCKNKSQFSFCLVYSPPRFRKVIILMHKFAATSCAFGKANEPWSLKIPVTHVDYHLVLHLLKFTHDSHAQIAQQQ